MERGLILMVAAFMVFVGQGMCQIEPEVEITREGCGVTKLCLETPDDCDPASCGSCLFTSLVTTPVEAADGLNISFELRGRSTDYIAVGLTLDIFKGKSTVFICINAVNAVAPFNTDVQDRDNLNAEFETSFSEMSDIEGKITDNVIRCRFNVSNFIPPGEDRSSRNESYFVFLGTGVYNGDINPIEIVLNGGLLNISDPTSNVAPTAAPTTMSSTTSGASSVLRPHALLLLLSVLTLSIKQRA